jgi:uncharacterized protein YrrD
MTSETNVDIGLMGNQMEGTDLEEVPLMGEGCELPLNFDIGARAHCHDGPCGKLVRLVVDPETEDVTDLIIEKGFLQKHDRVIPISVVKSTVDGEIRLAMESHSLNEFPEFREVEFRVPGLGWDSSRHKPENVRYWMSPDGTLNGQSVVPASRQHFNEGVTFGSKVIGRGTKVQCIRGGAGKVDHVLVDCAKGHITHLVVKRNLLAEYHVVPAELIESVEDEGVTLSISRDQVLALPRYYPHD